MKYYKTWIIGTDCFFKQAPTPCTLNHESLKSRLWPDATEQTGMFPPLAVKFFTYVVSHLHLKLCKCYIITLLYNTIAVISHFSMLNYASYLLSHKSGPLAKREWFIKTVEFFHNHHPHNVLQKTIRNL